MQRKKEVIRHILEYVRDHADAVRLLNAPNGDDLKSKFTITDKEVCYHVELCVQAGFLKVEPKDEPYKKTRIPAYDIVYLTWWGHEFLEGRSQRGSVDWPRTYGLK